MRENHFFFLKLSVLTGLILTSFSSYSQKDIKIKDNYGYTQDVLLAVNKNLEVGCQLIDSALEQIESVLFSENGNSIELWNSEDEIIRWLGKASTQIHIKKALARISKMDKICSRRITIVYNKEKRRGLCKGSRHAWTIPKGQVKIHLCPQFMYKSDKLKSKIFVHEMAHESGILFHKNVYWRSEAINVAENYPKKALKNPENFAFYIMSFYNK